MERKEIKIMVDKNLKFFLFPCFLIINRIKQFSEVICVFKIAKKRRRRKRKRKRKEERKGEKKRDKKRGKWNIN